MPWDDPLVLVTAALVGVGVAQVHFARRLAEVSRLQTTIAERLAGIEQQRDQVRFGAWCRRQQGRVWVIEVTNSGGHDNSVRACFFRHAGITIPLTLYPPEASIGSVETGDATIASDFMVRSGERRVYLGRAADAMQNWADETVEFVAQPVFGDPGIFRITL